MQIVTHTPELYRFHETISPEQAAQSQKNTVGFLITNSKSYRDWAAKPGHRTLEFDLPGVGVLHRGTGTILGYERLTGDPATSVGLTSIDKQPDVIQLGVQQPMVGDLLPNQPTKNTTIRYIQENSLTNAAAATAENAGYAEATWDLVEKDTLVRKIAALSRTTEEILTDFQGAAGYFNQRLSYMVQIKEDNQLLNGDGTGVNLTGILNTAGIQTQAQGNDTLPDAIMKAITKIRALAYFEPTGIVVNSQDWSNLVLMKDKAGQYYGAGPFMGPYGQMMKSAHSMWGIPIVLTTLIAQGTILVGAFNQGAMIHRRMGMTLEVSNSDASDFQYGRMAVRCTTRLALAVYRPLSFCTVTGSGAGGAFN